MLFDDRISGWRNSKQYFVDTPEEIERFADNLLTILKKPKGRTNQHKFIFQHSDGEKSGDFFCFNYDLNKKVAIFLIQNGYLKYQGKRTVGVLKYKAWGVEKNLKQIQRRQKKLLRIEEIINEGRGKKELLKRAIILNLNRYYDGYLNSFFKNDYFDCIAHGFEDFSIIEKKKKFILRENVCSELIEALNELIKNKKIRIHKNGYLTLLEAEPHELDEKYEPALNLAFED